jgi:hypothetical protein
MNKRRWTKTTLEQHELIIVRTSRTPARRFCADCSDTTALVTLNEAVRISGITSREVYRLMEAGRIHFNEGPDGIALICPVTLLRHFRKEEDRWSSTTPLVSSKEKL